MTTNEVTDLVARLRDCYMDTKRMLKCELEHAAAAPAAAVARIEARGMREGADEVERMIMYPGGRQEAPKHNSVWDAARELRKLAEQKEREAAHD